MYVCLFIFIIESFLSIETKIKNGMTFNSISFKKDQEKTFNSSLFLKQPKNQNDQAINCIVSLALKQFKVKTTPRLLTFTVDLNLTSPGHEIQEEVLQKLNTMSKWLIDTLSPNEINKETPRSCNEPKLTENYCKIEFKTSFYIMTTDSLTGFANLLKVLVTSKPFNLKAKYVIYYTNFESNYEEVAKDILQALWNYQVYKAVVIISSKFEEVFNLYTLSLFAPGEYCMSNARMNLIDTCENGFLKREKNLFYHLIPKNLNNCSISVITMIYPPYVIDAGKGFEIKLIREIARKLNVFLNISIQEVSTEWGQKAPNGSWTGKLKFILQNNALGIGNFQVNESMYVDFSFSSDYFYEKRVWVASKADKMPKWKLIFFIFKREVWLVLIGTLFLNGTLFYRFSLLRPERKSLRKLGKCYLVTLQALIGNSTDKPPKSNLIRTFFVGLLILNIILSALYTSVLITILKNVVYETQIDTEEKIIESNAEIGGLDMFKEMFNEKEDQNFKIIYKRYQIKKFKEDSTENWIRFVANSKRAATIMGNFYVQYLLAINDSLVCNPNGSPKIYVIKKALFYYPVKMVMPKNYILKPVIDDLIDKFVTMGAVEFWARTYLHELKKWDELKHIEDTAVKLSFQDVKGAFVLLMIGCGFALITFILELFCKI